MRNLQNLPCVSADALNLLGGIPGTGLRRFGGPRDIRIRCQHVGNFTGGLFGLDGSATLLLGEDGGQHGLDGLDRVLGRHGIRDVLAAPLRLIGGRQDEVRDDLKTKRDGAGSGHGGVLAPRGVLGGSAQVPKGLGGGVELEDPVGVLAVLALLLYDVGHELADGLVGGLAAVGELGPLGVEEGAGHGGLEPLEVALGHDGLDGEDGAGVHEGGAGAAPLGEVEDDKETKVLEGVGGPAAGRRVGVAQVVDDALGDGGLAKERGVVLGLGQVFDEPAGPAHALGLARPGLGRGGGVGEELFEDADEGVGVVEGGCGG